MERSKQSDFRSGFPRTTCGEALPGAVIELVLAGTGDRLDLLFWDGENSTIGQQVSHDGLIYQAPHLHPTLLKAMSFPRGLAADYGKHTELFWRLVDLFWRYTGVSHEAASYLSYVVICSWFPECDPGPITLCITGDLRQVLQLFRLLHALCRRGLVVAELSRRLPFFLTPTLLFNAASMSAKARGFWRASNFAGVHVQDAKGAVSNIGCTKIVFCESAESWESWGPEALHLSLLAVAGELPSLTQREADAIAAEYLPQLLMLRLRVLIPKDPAGDTSDSNSSGLTGSEVGRDLPLFLQGEPEIVEAVSPMLEAHDQELQARRSRDPQVACVEVLWCGARGE